MSVQASPRESGETVTRVTKDGRKLTYQLTVIQQPERARACGSGAKSSADRRPVDPPPVVELRIFEGDAKTDITFSYNANFFLFATLELARQVANGRVQTTAQQVPVLTGMPVSGMAYLDRPSEAGYFIFPDLSVRHEGRYRLSFNLYEETKEAKDADADQPGEIKTQSPPPAATENGSFDWCLEVKSASFFVYSAKKFPGLTESTTLSRTVAEQGCRVRIRRDVRMRRRNSKSSRDLDEVEDDLTRSRRTATPESAHDAYARQRSLSNSSVDRQPFVLERRSSGADYTQPPYPSNYAPPPPPPPPPSTITPSSGASGGYLTFGGSSAPQYQVPPYPPPTPSSQSTQNQAPYQPAPSGYNPPPPPPGYRPSSTYAYSDRQPYLHSYPSQRENYEPEHRRHPTAGFLVTSAQSSNLYPATEQNHPRSGPHPPHPSYPPRAHTPVAQSPVNLAPLKMLPVDPRYEHASSTGTAAGPGLLAAAPPPLPSPSYQDRPGSFSHFPNAGSSPSVTEPTRGSKRPYDAVFSSSSYAQPLHNGMRPSSSHHAQGSTNILEDDDENITMESLRMQYKRADGTSFSRELPAFE